MSKRKSIFNRITTLMLLAVIALTEVGFPTQAFAKKTAPKFKLSSSSISITKSRDVTLTSDKTNEKIKVTVQHPDVAYVELKKHNGKKTIYTVIPKLKGTTNVTFKAGKKKATLTVKVTKNSIQTIQRGFQAQLFIDNMSGRNHSVKLMIRNSTGLQVYLAPKIAIHGDLDYDGNYYDPVSTSASQFVTQYPVIGPNENKQIEYFDSPLYGKRMDSQYDIMTFQKGASVFFTAYFGDISADNTYAVTVDTSGVTSITKE